MCVCMTFRTYGYISESTHVGPEWLTQQGVEKLQADASWWRMCMHHAGQQD